MMVPCIDYATGVMNHSAFRELVRKNSTMPDIRRVIFNLKTEEPARDNEGKKIKDENGNLVMKKLDNPILATTIEFIDNTKLTVKNSGNDKIEFATVMLDKDGNVTDDEALCVKKVTVASEASKELGIVYGIWKRMFGDVDKTTGAVTGNGTSRILRELTENGYDPIIEAAKNTLKKAASKAACEAKQNAAASKPSNPSLAKTVCDLSENIKQMNELYEKMSKLYADTFSAK